LRNNTTHAVAFTNSDIFAGIRAFNKAALQVDYRKPHISH
jgi:hypothetical protein